MHEVTNGQNTKPRHGGTIKWAPSLRELNYHWRYGCYNVRIDATILKIQFEREYVIGNDVTGGANISFCDVILGIVSRAETEALWQVRVYLYLYWQMSYWHTTCVLLPFLSSIAICIVSSAIFRNEDDVF